MGDYTKLSNGYISGKGTHGRSYGKIPFWQSEFSVPPKSWDRASKQVGIALANGCCRLMPIGLRGMTA